MSETARWGSEPICKRRDRVPYGHQRQVPRTAGGPPKRTPKAANQARVGAKRDPRKSKGPGGRKKASREDKGGRSASPDGTPKTKWKVTWTQKVSKKVSNLETLSCLQVSRKAVSKLRDFQLWELLAEFRA